MTLIDGVNKNLKAHENRLVLSLDQNGKIVFFNKECEKIAGYAKNEALDRRILDFLIPERHRDKWEKILDSVKQDHLISNFELPWLSRNGEEVAALWAVAPVDGSNDRIGDIGLVGEVLPVVDRVETFLSEDVEDSEEVNNNLDNVMGRNVKERKDDFVLFRFKDKKLVFRKKLSSLRPKNVSDKIKSNDSSKKEEARDETNKNFKSFKKACISEDNGSSDKETKVNERETSSDFDILIKKYNHEKLEKNYELFNRSVESLKELEERIRDLEEENKNLKDSLKSVKANFTRTKNKLENLEKSKGNHVKKTRELISNSVNFLFDVVGGKKKKEEFDRMINELDERRTVLDDLEFQLYKEKKDLNKSRTDFVKWREKLELLEDKIEKRKEDIAQKEEKVRKNLLFFMDEDVRDETEVLEEESPFSGETDKDVKLDRHELLDKIPQSAAIVQRGILKQVNNSFVEMLGYNIDMLVEKNLFDFVIPEGFSGVEKYYLKRLKGERVSSYETMFHTKQDDNITVEVSTKPIIFNGEKAEIAVFKELPDEPEGAGAIAVDKKAEEKLKEPEEVNLERQKTHSEINDIVKNIRDRNEEEVSATGEVKVKPDDLSVSDEVIDKKEDVGVSSDVDVAGVEMLDKGEEEVSVAAEIDVNPERVKLDEMSSGKLENISSGEKISQAEIDPMMSKEREGPAEDAGDDMRDKPEDDVVVADEIKPEADSGEAEVKSYKEITSAASDDVKSDESVPATGEMNQAESDPTIEKMKQKKTN